MAHKIVAGTLHGRYGGESEVACVVGRAGEGADGWECGLKGELLLECLLGLERGEMLDYVFVGPLQEALRLKYGTTKLDLILLRDLSRDLIARAEDQLKP